MSGRPLDITASPCRPPSLVNITSQRCVLIITHMDTVARHRHPLSFPDPPVSPYIVNTTTITSFQAYAPNL